MSAEISAFSLHCDLEWGHSELHKNLEFSGDYHHAKFEAKKSVNAWFHAIFFNL